MRLKKERITFLAKSIVEGLIGKDLLRCATSREELVKRVEQVIFNEIRIEDRLNEEVRELLKGYEAQIKSGAVDYQKMFQMVKNKMAKERGVIL
jgi:hypothetical protein